MTQVFLLVYQFNICEILVGTEEEGQEWGSRVSKDIFTMRDKLVKDHLTAVVQN